MSHPIVEQILAGKAADPVKRAAAKGALPIPREDQLELWACIRNDADTDIRIMARENLASVNLEEWQSLLGEYPFRKEFFDFVVKVLAKDERLAILALRNRAMHSLSVEEMARTAQPRIIDSILDGQARLIECPGIVVALLGNPSLNATQGRRIFDVVEQFFRNHPTIPRLVEEKLGLKVKIAEAPAEAVKPVPALEEEVAQPPAPGDALAELADKLAAEQQGEAAEAPGVVEDLELPEEALKEGLEEEEVKNLYRKILTMSVPKKIELALKGNKEARTLLIRDSNKLIQQAVITSPKVTEQEIEFISKMRNLPEELLRKICMSQEWSKKYNIVKALATNPKCPQAFAMTFVSRLNDMDLKFLLKDKNVSEILRREGKKVWEFRHTPKKAVFKKH